MQASRFLFTVGTVSKCLASVFVNQSIHSVITSLQDRRCLDYSQFLSTNRADIAKNVQSYKYASHVQCCRYKQSNTFSCNCFGILLLLLLSLFCFLGGLLPILKHVLALHFVHRGESSQRSPLHPPPPPPPPAAPFAALACLLHILPLEFIMSPSACPWRPELALL